MAYPFSDVFFFFLISPAWRGGGGGGGEGGGLGWDGGRASSEIYLSVNLLKNPSIML